jgi:16S rRNA (guanine527-N7)-methyltransferase
MSSSTVPPDPATVEKLISRAVARAGRDLPGGAAGLLAIHLAMMLKWNRAMSLTAITDPDEAVRRHVLESLQAGRFVDPRAGALLDIGSGNGYPALPIKTLHPALAATLLEPAMRKSVFLETVIRAAGLPGVQVRRERVERPADLQRYPGTGNITMRAVGVIDAVIKGAAGILPSGGRLILMIGSGKADALSETLPSTFTIAARESFPDRRGSALLVLQHA